MKSTSPPLNRLTELFDNQLLPPSLTIEMLHPLAEALVPVLDRYVAKEDVQPDEKIFLAITKNFIQDGIKVQSLFDASNTEDWELLRQELAKTVQKNWGDLGLTEQDDLVNLTLIRIHRGLPGFLFKSSFSTWAIAILKNEYWRLLGKLKKVRERELSLDQENDDGITFSHKLPSSDADPQDTVAQQLIADHLWSIIESKRNSLEAKILRLHAEGHTLEDIKALLGEPAPSISTIQRWVKRLMQMMETDPLVREVAQQYGILSDALG